MNGIPPRAARRALLNVVLRSRVMEISVAKNFDDYVAVIAANSPHVLVMDWWRRLDLALRDYGGTLKPMIDSKNREAIEKAVSQDQNLGPGVADLIRGLRQLRNRVAHESINLSAEDATAYARQAFSVIAALARRVSERSTSRNRDCQTLRTPHPKH